jgi:hypothetical protein
MMVAASRHVVGVGRIHMCPSLGARTKGRHLRNVRNIVSINVGAQKIILGNSRNKVSFNIG